MTQDQYAASLNRSGIPTNVVQFSRTSFFGRVALISVVEQEIDYLGLKLFMIRRIVAVMAPGRLYQLECGSGGETLTEARRIFQGHSATFGAIANSLRIVQ